MIGPDPQACGGISAVVKLYEEYGLFSKEVEYLPSYKGGRLFYILVYFSKFLLKYIFTLIKSKNIEIVHIKSSHGGSFYRKFLAFVLAKIFGKKIIFHVHSGIFDKFYYESPYFIKKMIFYALKNSDLIISLSESWKSKILDICCNNIAALYNPTVIKEKNIKENNFLNVLFLGLLSKNKGVFNIIEAAKHIKSDNIKISLYGDGDRKIFEKIIKENNLQNKIEVKGWISGEEKEKALKNADVLILPSYNEGLPMSILEAMAVGLPIISTPVGGITEAVENEVNGFIIKAGDFEALAEKIDLLAGDRNLRIKMGDKGYKMAKEKFDINIIVKKLEDIYCTL
jgi:glycosyltransferase involved in cell wall biosynthesis